MGVDYTDWGTESYGGGVVTGSDTTCSEHSKQEYQTITAPEITVSARASYNVAIVSASTSKCQSVGTFDFGTGNELALNQDAGEVYGRMGAYGIIIQIKELSSGQGLKGVELPKSGEDITFNLSLDSTFTYTDENGTSHKLSLSDGTLDSAYTPLIWSFDANLSGSSQQDGRTIPVSTKCADSAPLNKLGSYYNSCYDGGSWSITQNSDGTYTVTVSNCVVNMEQLPYTNQAGNVLSTTPFYNPNNVDNYWEIGTACISAGEMWIVQPFYETDENTPGNTLGTYIVDEYGDGTFTTVLSDTSLMMTTESGNSLAEVTDNSNQAVTGDDRVSQSMAITKPGTISQSIQYIKYDYSAYNDPLTDGCWGTGQDWILAGDNLAIEDWVSHDSAEGGYTGVAYDVLFKFDDAFFEPSSDKSKIVASGVNGGSVTKMYAAKSDMNGWEHNGLNPDEVGYDTEMIYADIDDLVYFSTLEDLEGNGYTCVGVLLQYRGLVTEQMNHIHSYIKGSCKSDVEVDYVYMVTHCCRVWNRQELADASGISLGDILAKTKTEVNALVSQYIPIAAQPDSATPATIDYSNGYPSECYWVNGGEDGVGTQSDNIRNYTKPYYDESGYVSQTEGTLWGDSCLVVGYTSNVTLNVAQTTSNGAEKSSYDMDTNQRTVDYVVQGSIIRNNGTFTTDTTQQTTVTMTVTLPDGLSYLEGSSYIGGTYTSNGEGIQGTVTDGTLLTEDGTVTYTDEYGNEVSVTLTLGTDADGNTTLTYTIAGYTIGSDVTEYLDKIYFSCTIGTAGIEETDVKNNDSLVTSVTIETTEDCNRDFNTENANYAETGILISKNSAISLVKFADQSVVDVGDEMGFTMNVGNNGNSALSIVAVDALPYQGEPASSFSGDVIVTEFSVTSGSTADLDSLTFYYTDSSNYQGITSESITTTTGYSENSYFTDTNDWSELTLTETKTLVCDNEDIDHTHTDADCYEVSYVATWDVSDDFKPTAIVAVGTLAANTTLKMHITILLPDAKEGEYITNTLSRGNLSSTARCRTVNRTLSGLAWIDVDGDGYQDSDELTISDVRVALLKLKDGLDDTDSSVVNKIENYEAVCYTDTMTAIVIKTGQQIDVLRATGVTDPTYITTYTEGNYLFKNLSAGTYAVKFYTSEDDTGSFRFIDESTGEIYWSSPQNEGTDDTKDSDAEGIYIDSANAQSEGLQYTLIAGIEMPEASELEYATYSSPNHDSGVYKPVKRLRVVKYVYANDEENEPIPSEYKFLIDIDRVSGDDEVTVLDDYTTFALGTTEDISRYIDLDGEKGGTTFKLEEIVPMEYSLEEMIWIDTPETETEQKALTALLTADNGGKLASQVLSSYNYGTVNDSKVTIYPGDDITVILTNQPAHTSYFHHTASVTNSNTTKGTSGFGSIEDYDEDTDSESTASVTTLSMADVKIVALVDYRTMKRRMDDQEGGDWNEAI